MEASPGTYHIGKMNDPQKELIGGLVLGQKRGSKGILIGSMLIVVYDTDPARAIEFARLAFPDEEVLHWVCEAPRDIVERHKLRPGEAGEWRDA